MSINNIPADVLKLCKAAKIDPDQLPKTEEECAAEAEGLWSEIQSILSELRLDLETGHRDNDWRIAATHAKNWKSKRLAAIRGYRSHLVAERKNQVANVQEVLARTVKAHKEKIRKLHIAQQAQNVERKVYRNWISENAPEYIDMIDNMAAEARDRYLQEAAQ